MIRSDLSSSIPPAASPMDPEYTYGGEAADGQLKMHATRMASNIWTDSSSIPPHAMDSEYIDSIIARQLASLSVQEREKAYMDVHGVSEEVVETPQMIEEGLENLDRELKQLSQKAAYDKATEMNAAYTANPDFRLAFLRSELFDIQKAAQRLVRHFHLKLDLFGEDRLVSDITQDDLSRNDILALYSGHSQVLNSKDRAGRLIILNVTSSAEPPILSQLRRAFYNAMLASKDPVSQQKGVVIVYYFNDFDGSEMKSEIYWKLPKLIQSIPIRAVASHLCYGNAQWRPAHALMKTSFNLFSRVRLRTHYGTQMACFASLRGHGIDPGILPLTDGFGGTIIKNLESFHETLRTQRQRERKVGPMRSTIFVPSQEDVLFGKGTPIQIHPGNKRFRGLISEYQKRYEKAKKGEKIMLAQEIVETILESSGLFLKPDEDVWNVVDDDVARNKVSNAFRTLRMDQRKFGEIPSSK
eukprot:scaffold21162_cov83-Cylindrotheca_fusiformis.AAC.1